LFKHARHEAQYPLPAHLQRCGNRRAIEEVLPSEATTPLADVQDMKAKTHSPTQQGERRHRTFDNLRWSNACRRAYMHERHRGAEGHGREHDLVVIVAHPMVVARL